MCGWLNYKIAGIAEYQKYRAVESQVLYFSQSRVEQLCEEL